MGVMLLGEANREAPAQAELRPTCAGPAMSKRQRVEGASCVNLHLNLTPMGFTRGKRKRWLIPRRIFESDDDRVAYPIRLPDLSIFRRVTLFG